MAAFRVPRYLAETAAREDGLGEWIAGLPVVVADLAGWWSLSAGEPFQPGGQCSWESACYRAGRRGVGVWLASSVWRHAGHVRSCWYVALRCAGSIAAAKPGPASVAHRGRCRSGRVRRDVLGEGRR